MVNITFEEQAAILKLLKKWQSRRITPHQESAIAALEETLRKLIVFKQHVQALDHLNEQETNQVSEELLRLLRLPVPHVAPPATEE
jgi:hypothetical protein